MYQLLFNSLLVLGQTGVHGHDPEAMARTVSQGFLQSKDAIYSLRVSFLIEHNNVFARIVALDTKKPIGKSPRASVVWKQRDGVIRYQRAFDNSPSRREWFWDGGRRIELGNTHSKIPTGAIENVSYDAVASDANSPWFLGLFYSPLGTSVSFDKLLLDPSTRVSISTMKRDGKEYLIARLAEKGLQYNVTFDPSRNYLVKKYEFDDGRMTREVMAWSEPIKGIYFPAKVVSATRIGTSKVKLVTTVTFSDIRVNENVPAEDLSLALPPNTLVTDQVEGTIYRLDQAGNPTGDARPIPVMRTYQQQMKQHDRQSQWAVWLFAAGVLLAIVVAIRVVAARMRYRG